MALVAARERGCGDKKLNLPPGTLEADKLLFERGTEALNKKKWMTAREYFRQITEGYPQSQYRADAKLGLGDTHLGEGTTEGFVLARQRVPRVPDVLPDASRGPTTRSSSWRWRHYHQMPKPERDQTNSKEALKEFEVFFERFPNSALADEARQRQRETRDRLSESEYKVGLFYFRRSGTRARSIACSRVLKSDPEFTNRDAVYFYLAESLAKVKREAEALPYMERLVAEFESSEFLEKAKLRIAGLKAAVARGPAAQIRRRSPRPIRDPRRSASEPTTSRE